MANYLNYPSSSTIRRGSRVYASIQYLALFLLAAALCRSDAAAAGKIWIGHGPEGGLILSLAIDPQSPQTMYAGTWAGGVFKSTNGGTNWNMTNNELMGVICCRTFKGERIWTLAG
jgi:hypothetical protein